MQGLPTEYYTSASLFGREQERIFGRLWLFAGLRMMVAKSGAYCARTLAGRPILLQNLGGELACFLNVCAHRNAEVQPEGFDVRGLVCGYHGFRYAIDGHVAQIPHEEVYGYAPEERRCLRLRRYALEQVGQFLFVNFADSPVPLHEQFSENLLSDLEQLSSYLDSDVICATSTHRYNWKLPGENLRDHLHPRFVHPQTLAPIFEFSNVGEHHPSSGRATLRDLSYGGAEGRAKKDLSWPYWSQLERWPKATEDYYNWLLFPNLHVVSPDGCRTFGIEQYDPITADSTRLVHFMLTAKRKDPLPFGDALLRGALRSARTVLAEDAAIMESVQRGCLEESPTVRHGAYEASLNRFVQLAKELADG